MKNNTTLVIIAIVAALGLMTSAFVAEAFANPILKGGNKCRAEEHAADKTPFTCFR